MQQKSAAGRRKLKLSTFIITSACSSPDREDLISGITEPDKPAETTEAFASVGEVTACIACS